MPTRNQNSKSGFGILAIIITIAAIVAIAWAVTAQKNQQSQNNNNQTTTCPNGQILVNGVCQTLVTTASQDCSSPVTIITGNLYAHPTIVCPDGSFIDGGVHLKVKGG